MNPKILLLLCLFVTVSAGGYGQDYFNLEVNDIKGERISLRQFSGKKSLVYILPEALSDSLNIFLSDFRQRISDSVFMIGALLTDTAVIHFNNTPQFGAYVNFDQVLDLSTTPTSSSSNSFIGWLAERKLNGYGDIVKLLPGSFLVINEHGRLIACFSAKTRLNAPIVFKTLSFVKPLVSQ